MSWQRDAIDADAAGNCAAVFEKGTALARQL
jgi:hypothetical protein